MPKVTVLLTSYNHEKFINRTLDSILEQTFKDFNIIVIDDHSTDNSWEIIKEYQGKDNRIHAIRHRKNLRGSYMDSLYPLFDCKYIAIAHSDDIWDTTKLDKQVQFLDNHEQILACFTHVKLINEEDEDITEFENIYQGVFNQPNRDRFQWLRYFFDNGNCLCHPSVLIRKELYNNYFLMPNGLSSFPDFYRWIKVCKCGEIHLIEERLTLFRVRNDGELQDSGESYGKSNQIQIELFNLIKEYDDIPYNDMIKVFPEIMDYIVDGKIIKDFAFSKFLLTTPRMSYQLYGLKKLYELINIKESRKEIEKMYSYYNSDYSNDKKQHDIFNIISSDRFANLSLYIDYGLGYNETDTIKKKHFINSNNIVKIIVDLPIDKEIVSIRFDPDEGYFRKIKILDSNVKLVPVNGEEKNNVFYFYTVDPQFVMEEYHKIVKVTMEVETISQQELDSYIKEKMNEIKQTKNDLVMAKKKLININCLSRENIRKMIYKFKKNDLK